MMLFSCNIQLEGGKKKKERFNLLEQRSPSGSKFLHLFSLRLRTQGTKIAWSWWVITRKILWCFPASLFSSSKENKHTSSFVDGLYLLIREQHFPAVSLLLWEELPEAGRGFCSSGRLFTGQGWRQSVWEAAPSAELPQVHPVDGQVIWAPGFEEWTAGGEGMLFILKNGTWYVSSLEYTIKQGRYRLPLWMEERVRLQGATPSYACGLHPWGSQGPRVWSWLSQECPLGAMMSSDSTASRAKVGEWPHCLALKIKPLTFVKKHV